MGRCAVTPLHNPYLDLILLLSLVCVYILLQSLFPSGAKAHEVFLSETTLKVVNIVRVIVAADCLFTLKLV